jgi:anti-anti-sigma factor
VEFPFLDASQRSFRLPDARLSHTTVCGSETLRIAFAGEIDMSTAHVVVTVFGDALVIHRHQTFEVDLADVRFLDCKGVDALVRCRAQAARIGRRFAVTNPQPVVIRVLDLTGQLDLLTVESQRSAAAVSCTDEASATAVSGSRQMAALTREAARHARERAQAVLEDDRARRERMRDAWRKSSGSATPNTP